MRQMRKPRSHPRFSVSEATSLSRSTFCIGLRKEGGQCFDRKRTIFGRLPVLIPQGSSWCRGGVRSLLLRDALNDYPFLFCECENESNPWILPSAFQIRDEFILRVASSFPSRMSWNAGVFWKGCFRPQKSLRSQSRVRKGRRKFLELSLATAPELTRSKKLLIVLPAS